MGEMGQREGMGEGGKGEMERVEREGGKGGEDGALQEAPSPLHIWHWFVNISPSFGRHSSRCFDYFYLIVYFPPCPLLRSLGIMLFSHCLSP